MVLKKWEDLPDDMKNEKVRIYYDILRKKKASLIVKRAFDVVASLCALILLSPDPLPGARVSGPLPGNLGLRLAHVQLAVLGNLHFAAFLQCQPQVRRHVPGSLVAHGRILFHRPHADADH